MTLKPAKSPTPGFFNAHFAFSAAADRIVTVHYRPVPGQRVGNFVVWNTIGKALGSFRGPIPSVDYAAEFHPLTLSADGKRLAIVCFLGETFGKPEGTELRVIDTDTGTEVFVRSRNSPPTGRATGLPSVVTGNASPGVTPCP